MHYKLCQLFLNLNVNLFRFALDESEQNKPESEDEIHEHTESVQTNDTNDEDDEWNDYPVRYCIFYKLSFILNIQALHTNLTT